MRVRIEQHKVWFVSVWDSLEGHVILIERAERLDLEWSAERFESARTYIKT